MRKTPRTLAAASLAASLCLVSHYAVPAQFTGDPLRMGFLAPPNSAKPRVYWQWVNGNVTKEGIGLDLQWMHRIGIGGVLNVYDVSLGDSGVTDRPLKYGSAAWDDAFRHAVTTADKLNLEFIVAGSPGWNLSGGPWVKPKQAMKKLVWSETRIDGGAPFTGRLRRPQSATGPFQNAPINLSNRISGGALTEPAPDLYRDVALIAYRLPANDLTTAQLSPDATSSAGAIDSTALWDNDFTTAIGLPFGANGSTAWIDVYFQRPRTIQSMSLGLQGIGGRAKAAAQLEMSQDGSAYSTVTTLHAITDVAQTVTFAPTTARYFRLVLPTPHAPVLPAVLAPLMNTGQSEHRVAEFVLHTIPRVNHFEQKAGFFSDSGLDRKVTLPIAQSDAIRPGDVLDLTSQLGSDGSLAWTPPPGRWSMLRIGYSLVGATNFPASIEGTGLEVDKLSRAAVQNFIEDSLARYESVLGSALMGHRGLRAMETHSWQIGMQNWTDDMPAEFMRRRGYDLRPWLPALTGRIIGSARTTDQFLWDFRRTLGELLAESHYGQIATALRKRGMTYYSGSQEAGRVSISDGMDLKRYSDVPMAAMSVGSLAAQGMGDASIRESASLVHIHGQNLVGAESMATVGLPGAAFAFAPEDLKPTADRELSQGLNRFLLHSSVHQPLIDRAPGVTLGPFGQWFNRNETWARQAGPWITYLARSCYLLQQGQFVADVLFYYGQDSTITALYGTQLPAVPEGYAFDFANADALKALFVQDGLLATASGMRYRVLVLGPRTKVMSLDVLRRIASLVEAGATVIGDKPQETPSLVDDDEEFHALADAVWGSGATPDQRHGKGRTISGKAVATAIADLGLEPDFSYSKPAADTSVSFVHRRLVDADLYFISNQRNRAERIDARFRVSGKAAELWHADTAIMEAASFRQVGRQTVVPLNLDAHDAVFVVFREPTKLRERTLPERIRQQLIQVSGPWRVRFQRGRGAPEETTFTTLVPWNANADPRIRYFSGTAAYETSLEIPDAWLTRKQRVEIDLGSVKNLAEVLVNGHRAGLLWKPPFRQDITDWLKPGANRLDIRVTNLWPNRLIGDRQRDATPVAFTTFNPYAADSPLLASGLLGPVKLLRVSAGSGH